MSICNGHRKVISMEMTWYKRKLLPGRREEHRKDRTYLDVFANTKKFLFEATDQMRARRLECQDTHPGTN